MRRPRMQRLTIFVPMSNEKMTFVQRPFAQLLVAVAIDYINACLVQIQVAVLQCLTIRYYMTV